MTKFNRILLVIAAMALTMGAWARGNAKLPNMFNDVDQVAMNHWVDSVYNTLSPDSQELFR